MGSYSQLTIGKLVFEWKYHVPTFLTFLFQESDFFSEPEELDPDNDEYYDRAGYRTTVAAAKEALDRYGYTVEFFAEIYESFRPDLDAALREELDDEFGGAADGELTDEQVHAKVAAHLAKGSGSGLDDLRAFTAFLREAIEKDLQMEPLLDDYVYERGAGLPPGRHPVKEFSRYRATDLADFESLQVILLNRTTRLPPGVVRAAMLFEESWLYYFPEVVSLIYTRLVLDAVTDDAIVELDMAQVVDREEALRSMHSSLALDLLLKVDVYQRVFRALSDREEHVQDRFARTTAANALATLRRAEGSQAKGEALEELMAAVFSISPQLQVVERKYSTGDEEIDLVVKNNVDRPFWQGLGSPLLFVECKNWAKPVGAPEIRNFEGKLQNHAPLARVGILVAPGGFTSEVSNAIRRSSRDQYTLALVRGEDLIGLTRGSRSVLDWLEALLCRPL
jgi:Restriction endonuclease/HEPN/Toprim N-terminal domain 1